MAVAVAGPVVAGRRPIRAHVARHAEHTVVALAVLAAAVLVVPPGLALVGGSGGAAHPAGHEHASGGSPALGLGGWMAMVAAMMLPLVAGDAGRVARRSLWGRRVRSVVCFLAGYLAVWTAVGGVLLVGLRVAGVAHPPAAAPALALVLAAGWQVAPARRRLLARCRTTVVRPRRGRAADLDTGRSGVRLGGRCALVCGPVMAAMALGHGLLLMAALTVLLHTERAAGPNPHRRAARPHEAAALVGLAAVVLAVG